MTDYDVSLVIKFTAHPGYFICRMAGQSETSRKSTACMLRLPEYSRDLELERPDSCTSREWQKCVAMLAMSSCEMPC